MATREATGRRYTTVGELVEQLRALPQDVEVRVVRRGDTREPGYGEGTTRVGEVELRDVGERAYLIPRYRDGEAAGPRGEPRETIAVIG